MNQGFTGPSARLASWLSDFARTFMNRAGEFSLMRLAWLASLVCSLPLMSVSVRPAFFTFDSVKSAPNQPKHVGVNLS
jgi:hypothetical protein